MTPENAPGSRPGPVLDPSTAGVPHPGGAPGAGALETTLPRISVETLIGPEGISGPERFLEFLRAATRQCRRLVDCEIVRIWGGRSRGGGPRARGVSRG